MRLTQRETFDDIAQNIAEAIDDVISTVPRERERRIQLIRCQVRRALNHGYRAAKAVDTLAIEDGVR
jgi:hypothetical protein